jgi:hypothetical protein
MIIVDLDDLAPEAVAEVVQGSRQGLFRFKLEVRASLATLFTQALT